MGLPNVSKQGLLLLPEEPKDICGIGMRLAKMTQDHWEICALLAPGNRARYNRASKVAPGAYVWASEPSPSA